MLEQVSRLAVNLKGFMVIKEFQVKSIFYPHIVLQADTKTNTLPARGRPNRDPPCRFLGTSPTGRLLQAVLSRPDEQNTRNLDEYAAEPMHRLDDRLAGLDCQYMAMI